MDGSIILQGTNAYISVKKKKEMHITTNSDSSVREQ
uniref:Uncharacterized protein n=1 Tax=Arundo donax TaxID=35708 RepID=A0A0A9BXB2_ARUDO